MNKWSCRNEHVSGLGIVVVGRCQCDRDVPLQGRALAQCVFADGDRRAFIGVGVLAEWILDCVDCFSRRDERFEMACDLLGEVGEGGVWKSLICFARETFVVC